MTKHIEIGKDYHSEYDSRHIIPLRGGRGSGTYICRTYEVDDDGNEIHVTEEACLTAHDILRR